MKGEELSQAVRSPVKRKITPVLVLAASAVKLLGLLHPGYQKLILLSPGRSGTTLVLDCLSCNHEMRVHQEVYSDWFAEQLNPYWKILHAKYPLLFLNLRVFRYYPNEVKGVIFKILYHHCPADENKHIWDYLSRTLDIKVLHLKRNLLRVYISYQLAEKYKVWHAYHQNDLNYIKAAKIEIHPKECQKFIKRVSNQCFIYNELFKNHDVFEVWYEQLSSNLQTELARIQTWIGVSPIQVHSKTIKQTIRPIKDIVTNYAELEDFFHGSIYENLFVD
jgi:hypothetical protein